MNSSTLANELINIFGNASIGTAVIIIISSLNHTCMLIMITINVITTGVCGLIPQPQILKFGHSTERLKHPKIDNILLYPSVLMSNDFT